MGLMNWEFVFKRRKISLEKYLLGCTTIDAAKEKFHLANLIPPSDEVLISHGLLCTGKDFQKETEIEKVDTPREKSQLRRSHRREISEPVNNNTEEQEGIYDDLVIIDTPE
jgi:hypothetical protein